MFYEKNERRFLSYIVLLKSSIKCLFPKQNDLPGIKIRTLEGLRLLDASNKKHLKGKMTWLDVYISR